MTKRKSLSDLADAVLGEVDRAQLEKTAAATYTVREVSSPEAQALIKVAAEVRSIATDTRITYEDLAAYRKSHAR